ncbi:MAG: hypothetical protein ACOYM3_10565 [Terrimicrobiaceae bacterium]
MKNFETTFNRWLDGSLDDAERQDFEASLDAETLRSAKHWPRMKSLLQESARQINLPHPEFLNEQIRRAIEAPFPRQVAAPAFSIRRLVWAGVFCVGMAAALSVAFLQMPPRTENATVVVCLETAAAGISASAFQTGDSRAAVIWLEGLPFIPGEDQVR